MLVEVFAHSKLTEMNLSRQSIVQDDPLAATRLTARTHLHSLGAFNSYCESSKVALLRLLVCTLVQVFYSACKYNLD